MGITVHPLDPADDTAMEQAYEIARAASLVDHPDFPVLCPEAFGGRLRHPFPGRRFEAALARLDGEPAGYLGLDLPQRHNTANASANLFVAPARRRRGVGRALHRFAVQRARAQGRKRLIGMAVRGLQGGGRAPGAAFAAAVGARPVLPETRSRLDVSGVVPEMLEGLLAGAWPHAAGYHAVTWRDRTPPEYADDVAYLDSRLMQDAPTGELDWEPEHPDAEHLRETESVLLARGFRGYHAGVRHEDSGRLVAWTLIGFDATEGWHAWQQITIVEPRHRGHRLGLIAKIENLRQVLAAEPALTAVDTWNATDNHHMIAVNTALGFRAVDAWDNWQQVL